MNQGPHSYAPPIEKKRSNGLIVGVAAGSIAALLFGVTVLVAVALQGTHKYVQNAKLAEARAALGAMGKGAVAAYEAAGDAPDRALCPSARAPVPGTLGPVTGKTYQSSPREWRDDPGFACLGFEMVMPQLYQYDFASDADDVSAKARGDLDGDGVPSSFELVGKVEDGVLVLAPALIETNPQE